MNQCHLPNSVAEADWLQTVGPKDDVNNDNVTSYLKLVTNHLSFTSEHDLERLGAVSS